MGSRAVSLILALSMLVVAKSAWADSIVVIPGAGGIQNSLYNGDVTIGWQFELITPFDVTGLGYFDANSDGLFDPHDVGIFDNSGTLRVSATVPGGTAGILDHGFRFVPIATTHLGAGKYTVGGFGHATSQDEFKFNLSPGSASPGLILGTAVQSSFGYSGLTFPQITNLSEEQGIFGPNFRANVGAPVPIPTPEPASLFLVSSGVFAVLLRRRRA